MLLQTAAIWHKWLINRVIIWSALSKQNILRSPFYVASIYSKSTTSHMVREILFYCLLFIIMLFILFIIMCTFVNYPCGHAVAIMVFLMNFNGVFFYYGSIVNVRPYVKPLIEHSILHDTTKLTYWFWNNLCS